ncbi:hypothetical protein DAPPUDRAFT_342845, partial [Daphnia pulex]
MGSVTSTISKQISQTGNAGHSLSMPNETSPRKAGSAKASSRQKQASQAISAAFVEAGEKCMVTATINNVSSHRPKNWR